jgi:predicted nucleotidyltransferase
MDEAIASVTHCTYTLLPMVTENRTEEVQRLLATLREWAQEQRDVVAAGLVGSWARGEARMDSDVDVVLLTEDQEPYLRGVDWVYKLGGIKLVKTRRWGTMTERRFALPSGLEVEVGVASPSWAATEPVDAGTRQVVTDGMSIVYDPQGLLAELIYTCDRQGVC